MRKVLDGFKTFIMRGNVIDLAVAVVIGAAFSGLVKALVDDFISPLIGMIVGKPKLADLWNITFRHATISVGGVLDAALNFLIIASAVYFLIVLPLNYLAGRRKKGIEPEPEAPSEDILLLQEIRDLLAGRGTSPSDTSAPASKTPVG
jgi:large conductance mechanosensitive channel